MVQIKPKKLNKVLIDFRKKKSLKKLKRPLLPQFLAKTKKLKLINQKLESLRLLNNLKSNKKRKIFSLLRKTTLIPELKYFLKDDLTKKELASIKKIKQYVALHNYPYHVKKNLNFLKISGFAKQFSKSKKKYLKNTRFFPIRLQINTRYSRKGMLRAHLFKKKIYQLKFFQQFYPVRKNTKLSLKLLRFFLPWRLKKTKKPLR